MERTENCTNDTFVKNEFQTYDLVPFLLALDIFRTMSFCFCYWFLTGIVVLTGIVIQVWKAK